MKTLKLKDSMVKGDWLKVFPAKFKDNGLFFKVYNAKKTPTALVSIKSIKRLHKYLGQYISKIRGEV